MSGEDICETIKSELTMLSAVEHVTATHLPPTNAVQGLVVVNPKNINNTHTFASLLSVFVSVRNFRIVDGKKPELTSNTVFNIPEEYSRSSKQVIYEYIYNTKQMCWASE
jgi:hypothetical protein